MKKRSFGLVIAATAFAVLLPVSALVVGCDQNPVQCTVGQAGAGLPYVGVAKLVSATDPKGECAGLSVMELGMDNYHAAKGPPTNTRDTSVNNAAIQDSALFGAQDTYACFGSVDPNPAHHLYSFGKFKALNPDANDMCHIDFSTNAEQDFPAVKAADPAQACVGGTAAGGLSPLAVCDVDNETVCANNLAKFCLKDKDCGKTAPKGTCGAPPLKVCTDPLVGGPYTSPDFGTFLGCNTAADCCNALGPNGIGYLAQSDCAGATCDPDPDSPDTTGSFDSFCANDPKVVQCASDDDCCAPGDTACTSAVHTCVVPGVDPSSCHTDALPADTIKYEWSNFSLYTTASATGTQISADLSYTAGGCTAQYKVTAVWPEVSCDDGTGMPFDEACCPGSDIDAGLPVGSGIDPDFAVHCDHTLLLCVLDGDVPSLNKNGNPKGCPAPQPIQ